MTKMRRSEVVKVFNENTAGQDFAKNISACVYSIFIRDFMAYTYVLNEIIDRLQDDYPKLYRHEVKHICNKTEKGYKDILGTMRTKYGVGYYENKMQDLARIYFGKIRKDVDMIRMQVLQVFTKQEETNRVLLSFLFTAIYITDVATHQWEADVSELERIFYIKRKLLPADIDVRQTFGALRIDVLAHDLRALVGKLQDRCGDVIDLNKDPNIVLASKIFLKRLNDQDLVLQAIDEAGLMQGTNKNEE